MPARIAAIAVLAVLSISCGKRGAPLAPLNLIPEPPSAVSGKRMSATVYVQMVAPRRNANGPGVVALDHLEVYAVTVRPGLLVPANRDLLMPQYVVGQIPIKPPPDDEQPADEQEDDTRSGPGEPVTFTEQLTEKELQASPGLKPVPPVPTPPPATAAAGAQPPATAAVPAAPAVPPEAPPIEAPTAGAPSPPATPPPQAGAPGVASPTGAPGAAAPTAMPGAQATAPVAAPVRPAGPTVPVRVYVVRGVTKKGRPGPPSGRVTIPLVPAPSPPGNPSATFTEQSVSVTWLAPVPASAESPAMAFNVYSAPAGEEKKPQAVVRPSTPSPLNTAPLAVAPFEHAGAAPGVAQCFIVRTVARVGDVSVESDPTPPVCVTPRDIFPPAAPKGLAVVAMDGGVMNLIWDANTESDLGGYLILRGEAPGDTLQPLTPQPIHDTSFRDTTVTPGVRYIYVIVAVDRATPPNRSQASARVEETAR